MSPAGGDDPPYLQILEHYRHLIRSGELAPGKYLPTEQTLAQDWGVSRGTVTKALNFLREEGWVTSRRGKGTTVNVPPQSLATHPNRHAAVRQAIQTHGEKGTLTMTYAGFAPASSRVADALAVEEGAEVVKRSRVRHHDGHPVTMSTSWHPGHHANAVPHLLINENMPDGLARVENATGTKIGRLHESLSAGLATTEHADFFGFELPAAVMHVEHTWWDTDDHPFCFGQAVHRADEWWTYNVPTT
jgi:DNA-binding GntR family transcriptional regulator